MARFIELAFLFDGKPFPTLINVEHVVRIQKSSETPAKTWIYLSNTEDRFLANESYGSVTQKLLGE